MNIKRFITPPRWGSDENAKKHMKGYIKNIESMLIDSGLVKSVVDDNMDTDNINFPLISLVKSTSNEPKSFYIDKPLQFDMADSGQVITPIRIKFYFGFYKYGTNISGANKFPVFVSTKIELFDIKTGAIICTSRSMIQDALYSSYYFKETSEGYVPNYYGGGNDSIVINRDGFLAINITPEWYEYASPTPIPSYVSSAFFIIIQRFGKNINIISNSLSIASNREVSGGLFNYVYDTNAVLNLNNTLLHYVDTGSAYNNGVISIYPSYIINELNDIKQSDNVIVFNKNAISTGGEIELKDKNGLTYTFVSFSSRMDTYFKNTGRIAVRL